MPERWPSVSRGILCGSSGTAFLTHDFHSSPPGPSGPRRFFAGMSVKRMAGHVDVSTVSASLKVNNAYAWPASRFFDPLPSIW